MTHEFGKPPARRTSGEKFPKSTKKEMWGKKNNLSKSVIVVDTKTMTRRVCDYIKECRVGQHMRPFSPSNCFDKHAKPVTETVS